MSDTKQTAPAPSGERTVINDQARTVQLAWNRPPPGETPAVGGIAVLRSVPPCVVVLRPGLNYCPAEALTKVGPLPPNVRVEDPTRMPEGYAADLVAKTGAASLRRWAKDEKRPEIKQAIADRLRDLAEKRKAA